MPFGHIEDLENKVVNNPLADKAKMRVLVGPNEGWDSHVMRVFEVEAGGYTPKHQHDWPHINYILEGEGTLLIEGELQTIKAGHYAYIPSNTLHQFKASEHSGIKFICMVPKENHY